MQVQTGLRPRRALHRQTLQKRSLRVQRDHQFGDFDSHCILKFESKRLCNHAIMIYATILMMMPSDTLLSLVRVAWKCSKNTIWKGHP
jgi:hypothetical protein